MEERSVEVESEFEKNEGREVKILYTETEIMIMEGVNDKIVLDTGCASTCEGRKWVQNHLESLNEEDAKEVSKTKSCKTFRFGAGGSISFRGID